jgi:hypothetical protein
MQLKLGCGIILKNLTLTLGLFNTVIALSHHSVTQQLLFADVT